jgi:HlyD family secretion protein
MRKKVLVAVIALLAIAGVVAYQYLRISRNDGTLPLSGTVEVTEVNVGFKVPGRIADLQVQEG